VRAVCIERRAGSFALVARPAIDVHASPGDVWAVLADPFAYADWVPGSHQVRAADAAWPGPDTALHHTVGRPPLAISDRTEVLETEPPQRLQLLARARPLPSALVTLDLQPVGGETRVTMVEDLANPLLNLLLGPLGHAAMKVRVRESLRRLKRLAERGAGSSFDHA
jgi:uncharacterized protein YndB with AHSA1/START domain